VRQVTTETTTKNDGSPNPTVQGKDGETAGTDSEQRVKKVAPLIDSDTIDAVIHLGGKAEALEPGFDARAWLGARGL